MDPVTGLSLGRIALGVASLVRPERASTGFGLDAAASPGLPYVLRLFGAREMMLLFLDSEGHLALRLEEKLSIEPLDDLAANYELARDKLLVLEDAKAA